MRVLLVNPPRSLRKYNIWSIVKSTTPPIGLALLAAVLEQGGIEADIIDAQALGLGPGETVEVASGMGKYDLIGLSSTTPEITAATMSADLFRKTSPEAKILFGGVHPTVFHRELVQGGIADYVIRGEAEGPISALCRSGSLNEVPALTWKDKAGEVIVNPMPEKLQDLEALPLPAYHKLPMKQYRSALGAARRSPSLGVITSRGCPGTCTFCYSGMFGKKVRFESAGRVYDHLLFLKKDYGIREISFYDDTFTHDRSRVISLCRRILDEKLDLSWSCFARVDTVDAELLCLMKKAGCHQIMYGFESGDDAVLKTINKRVSSRDYQKVAAMTTAAGIDVRGAFMLGSPEETEQSLIHTIEFAKDLGIRYAIFNITTPYPGTVLYKWAEKHGLLRHSDWEKFDLAHPVMDLPGLSAEAITRQYRNAYSRFYLRPAYILRSLPALLSGRLLKQGFHALRGIISLQTKNRY